MRKGILSLGLPGARRSGTRKPNNMTRAEQQAVAQDQNEQKQELTTHDTAKKPIQDPTPPKPKEPSLMKATMRRHDEIVARVHKRSLESKDNKE